MTLLEKYSSLVDLSPMLAGKEQPARDRNDSSLVAFTPGGSSYLQLIKNGRIHLSKMGAHADVHYYVGV